MSWKLEHREGETIESANYSYGLYSETQYVRSGYMAGPRYVCRNAHSVVECHHHSGSGPINGEKDWPHVKLDVSFPTGCENKAVKLSERLRDFIDQFLKEEDLDPVEEP